MRRIIIVLAVVSCLCALPAAAQRKGAGIYVETEVVPVQKPVPKLPTTCGYQRPIRVAGFVTNPPFGWVDQIGQSIPGQKSEYINNGLGIHIFRKLAGELRLKVVDMPFLSYQDAVVALAQGKIDVLLGVYYDRQFLVRGTYLVTPSYFKNGIIALFMKGKERSVETYADLRGLKGVVRLEEGLYSLVHQNIPEDIQITTVSGARQAFSMLLTGEADFMLTSPYAAEAEARRFKMDLDLASSEYLLFEPDLFFAFSTSTDCLMLARLFQQKIQEKDLGRETLDEEVRNYINEWGQRFKDAPSLAYELENKIVGETPSISDEDQMPAMTP